VTNPASTLTKASPSRRRRRIVFGLTALFGVGLFLLGALEAALWLFAPLSFHEWLVWIPDGNILGRLQPNQTADNAGGNQVHINKYGFRGPDYTYRKAPGTLRIAVFGGSSAFEFLSSSDEKTWPGAVEKKLRDRLHMPVEVINLALPGMDNFQAKINYLCNGRAFKPDVAIFYEAVNDLGGRRFRKLDSVPFTQMGPVQNRPLWMDLARKTQIGRRARIIYFNLIGRSMEGLYVHTDEKKEPIIGQPIHPDAWAWYRRNLEDEATFTRTDGVLCVLCSQAMLGSRESIKKPEIQKALEFSPDRCGMTLEILVDVYEHMCEVARDVANKYDCIFFDGYHAVPHDLDHIRDSVHFFDKGSEALAQAMTEHLLTEPRFMAVVERVRRETAPSAVTSTSAR